MNSSSPFGFIGMSLVSAALIIFSPSISNSAPGDITLEGFAGLADGPEDNEVNFDLGSTMGFGGGIGYEVEENLLFHLSIGFFNFEEKGTGTFFGVPSLNIQEELSILEVLVGARESLMLGSRVQIFGEFGVSANILYADGKITDSSGLEVAYFTDNETIWGLVPGVGCNLWLTPWMALGFNGRYHYIGEALDDVIDLSFYSIAGVATLKF